MARYLFGCLIRSPSFRHLVVNTEALRRHFEQAWSEFKDRIVVTPDGTSPLEVEVQQVDLGRYEDRIQACYTGNLHAGKGAALVAELACACPHHDFHLFGGTEADLRHWRAGEGLPDSLRLRGHQALGRLSARMFRVAGGGGARFKYVGLSVECCSELGCCAGLAGREPELRRSLGSTTPEQFESRYSRDLRARCVIVDEQ